jgi:hypothetical protein
MSLTERFQKIDPYLGAMVIGAKVTRHGARITESPSLVLVINDTKLLMLLYQV